MCVCDKVCVCVSQGGLGVVRTGVMVEHTNKKGTSENKSDSDSSFQAAARRPGWEEADPSCHVRSTISPAPPPPPTTRRGRLDLTKTQRQKPSRCRTSRHQASVSHRGISPDTFFLFSFFPFFFSLNQRHSSRRSALCPTCAAPSKSGAMCRAATLMSC